ncbi:MAG: polyprenyl synthetase family protein [Phototrophicaceae bacterium]|jgi:geranylgeranyl pyrophosphate synthase
MTLHHSNAFTETLALREIDWLDTDTMIEAVDQLMMSSTESDVQLLTETSHHIIGAGGKRVRPRLLLLSYLALGGTDIDYVLPVAASLELVHTASVVHDDINDHGVLRRGRPSINAKWGRTFALLTGDFLFTKVYELMADYSSVNRVFAVSTKALVEGETLQAAAVKEGNFTPDVYLRVIALKTAELFRASTLSGAILAGATPSQQDSLSEFGFKVGMAFQIMDDVLDITGNTEQLGKTAGLDLQQGKGFTNITDPTANDPMARIKTEMMKGDRLEQASAQANHFIESALEDLDGVPDSAPKDKLIELAHQVIDRTH